MMAFGFLGLVLGAVLVALSIFAEANHPTGGNRLTAETFGDGCTLMAIGVIIMALRWWIG